MIINSIQIVELDNITTINYPIQIGRVFKKGEIVNFPQAVLNGNSLTTQSNVKSRWGDGSVKHAVVSFLIPTLSASTSATAS